MSDHAFREATGQELARLVRFVLSPLEWRSLAADAASRLTGASSRFFTCTKCDFLVRVCMRCQEVCRAGDAACAGCGRVFHGSKS